MAKKTITFTLDEASINEAIREIEEYRDDLPRKMKRLRNLVGERIAWSASRGFRTALVGDIVSGNYEPVNDVTVSVDEQDNMTVVIADGNEAVFIEYGAGISNNGAARSSPHPWGAEQGFLIGTYGKGLGARPIWAFKSEDGEKVLTRGTPAAMPMYRGWMDAKRVLDDLIEEVF